MPCHFCAGNPPSLLKLFPHWVHEWSLPHFPTHPFLLEKILHLPLPAPWHGCHHRNAPPMQPGNTPATHRSSQYADPAPDTWSWHHPVWSHGPSRNAVPIHNHPAAHTADDLPLHSHIFRIFPPNMSPFENNLDITFVLSLFFLLLQFSTFTL